jgi:hypothetical protein
MEKKYSFAFFCYLSDFLNIMFIFYNFESLFKSINKINLLFKFMSFDSKLIHKKLKT